jgi:hypothetical protein
LKFEGKSEKKKSRKKIKTNQAHQKFKSKDRKKSSKKIK